VAAGLERVAIKVFFLWIEQKQPEMVPKHSNQHNRYRPAGNENVFSLSRPMLQSKSLLHAMAMQCPLE
jgi:hypothetical protein